MNSHTFENQALFAKKMKRMTRVNELLKREVGVIVEREIAYDLKSLITVTGVNTAPDLRHAIVHVSVYGDENQQQHALKLLRKKRVGIQNMLSKTVRIKYTPVLQFHLDDQLEKADRIYKILDNLSIPDEQDAPESEL